MNADTFNELPSHVWPTHARRQEDGVVTIAGVPLPEIVEEYGSPAFVIDEADFRCRCRTMAEAFGGADHVHYAAKAFLTRAVARWVDEEGLCLDVASDNELQIALAAEFPAERIAAHGNNKTVEFLRRCVERGVGRIVLDSFQEIERLGAVAEQAGVVQPVLVRVKPGIEAHTHEFIATAHEDQKFGFSLASGSALKAAREVLEHPHLRLVGLHCHVGSQVFDAEGFSQAAERVLGLLGTILSELGSLHPGGREGLAQQLSTLDLGGGYGIAYLAQEQPLDVAAVAADLLAKVAAQAEELALPTPTVMVEPGRAIAGPSTVTVYTVGTVKDVHVGDDRVRRYLSVDGGMSDNIRPALYGAQYDARVVSRFVDGDPVESRVVGSHCESGDILIENAHFPNDIEPGDILAIPATGAYCYAMSSRYNAFGRPPVIVVSSGKARVMLRRETVEDLLALEAE
ncbi:diaminopimelate decarboxylase [Corynebacterium lowii]|uniref:Diaminopimelate decarboxylase n=1 Tax=Corynebacterium lowii TaxID=1544413 RepID=A0A0Q0UEQ9_9CORY|nr:diaminopimelate decarboxylase [Corynebacterium lowii]KQB86345.1 Diaminopimelate decarboxylase [Corynebacterium lowii]MDP9850830.1 diaminopimelate decarboxylase [Corynebacterium lowii]